KEQLNIALEEQKVTKELLGKILVRMGFLKREALYSALAEINPTALIGDCNVKVEIPNEVLLETQSILLGDTGKEIYIATLNANTEDVIATFKKHVNGSRQIKLVAVDYKTIVDYLSCLKKGDATCSINEETDVNKVVNSIIDYAVSRHATDIHIESSEKTIHLRLRIDGVLKFIRSYPLSLRDSLFSRIKDLAGMDVSEKRIPQDGSFSLEYKGRTIDFRVSTIPGAYGEKITIRVLDKERLLLDITELGITQLDEWIRLSRLPNGLILVCGATGSGKTTTLYATVTSLNTLNKSVYMIEEPIEYRIPFVTQVQVNRRIHLDYASFLRAVLRHDPDVCIIGEIRDKETAENAVRLADTGHLVYATLHTNDVPSSIIRLLDLGVDKSYLKFVLRGVLVQKLLRKLCPHCKGIGCDYCNDGYKGMTLITEFATIDSPDDIEAILEGIKPYQTFEDDIRLKLSCGITDIKEVERVMGVKINSTSEAF
ncbi:MAG: Flp pilus assembly complex ATPase component TadA, partial [Candidatus Omnitrophica bacterium]|nr:Flp pilus assembly complex ATPase component TadA [Candidatus Omnitrophota bacterium]